MPRTSDRGLGDDAEPRSSAVSGRPRLSRRRVVQALIGLICLVVLVFAYQLTRTVLAVHRADHDVDLLFQEVRHDDAAGVRATLIDVRDQARIAHGHSDNVMWAALTHLPWLGGDIRAIRQGSAALDSASTSALPTALDLFQSLHGQQRFRTKGGQFDLAAISRLQAPLHHLGTELTSAKRDLAGIDPDRLKLGPVAHLTRQFQDRLALLDTVAGAGSTAARVLPPMLGSEGPRTYLLVVQNNAEVRSTGGLAGSLLVLHADHGKITLGKRYSSRLFPRSSSPVIPVTKEEKMLYGNGIAEDIREANETPDFPRVGRIIDGFYDARYGRHIDGVLATDPVALAGLLDTTGPMKVDGESFDADNVVRKLLNTTYLRFEDPAAQDAYYARAAKTIFDKLITRPVKQLDLVKTFSRIASDRRILVWSRHPREQRALAGATVSGALPRASENGAWTGMYLNDAMASKMEYYLHYVGGVKPVSCSSDGTQRFDTRLRLHSTAPRDPSGLPVYVTGDGSNAPKGSIRVSLRIYGPPGGKVTGIVANGKALKPYLFTHDGHPVAFLSLLLKPQGDVDVTAHVQTAAGQRGAPTLVWTPGVQRGATSVVAPSACS